MFYVNAELVKKKKKKKRKKTSISRFELGTVCVASDVGNRSVAEAATTMQSKQC